MQAVVLTAGRSCRMEPFSSICHKAPIEIGDTTFSEGGGQPHSWDWRGSAPSLMEDWPP